MVNLFDIVRQAQGGLAIENMARQFGLSGDQTRLAVEAFLPAFSLALQRSAGNPAAFGGFLDAIGSGRYATFFDGGAAARPTDGQQLLDRIFGSPEVSRQVAAQAAAATGIGVQVLQQMLPSIAALVMGGLFRFATVEGFADFLRGWSDWLRRMNPPQTPPRQSGGASPFAAWTDLMTTMMGGTPPAPAPPPAADPWSGFLQALAKPSAPKPPPPPPAQPDPFAALSHMIETGRDVQAQHLANLQAVFDGLRDATAPR